MRTFTTYPGRDALLRHTWVGAQFNDIPGSMQYDEISLTFTAGPVCLCGVSSPVVVLGLFVRLS